MCIYCMLIYVRDRTSQGRRQQCGARGGFLQKNSERFKSCHIFARSICGNQAAGKAEEDEEAEEVAVSTFYQSLPQPRRSSWSFWATFSSSDSMAARLSISGSCRYNERAASGKRILRVQTIIYIRANFSCTTALTISRHNQCQCIAVWAARKDTYVTACGH